MESVTLLELNRLIAGNLSRCMPGTYWVQAEISSMNSSGAGGHCYLELVQKDTSGRRFLAKVKANIWAGIWSRLKVRFEQSTGQRLQVGMKVLLQAEVQYHEVYGLSLVVYDIDPTYTMGDMARRRREILAQLEAEGVIGLNRELPMPMVPQRIAIVSSATAAGYGDFCNQLTGNPYGFQFTLQLFPALMQGDGTEASVIQSLNVIARQCDRWDVVVIIRGGGSVSELSCFDSYMMAMNIANFPLPVITGIGHERDDTVCDVVAHTKVKTPTAAAELLLARVLESAQVMETLARRMAQALDSRMNMEKMRLQSLAQTIPSLFLLLKEKQEKKLDQLWGRMTAGIRVQLQQQEFCLQRIQTGMGQSVERYFTDQRHRLDLMEQKLQAANPERILARGYSVTMKDGRAVTGTSSLKKGDMLTTRLADGTIESVII
ncbi:MAG: exodeoxyribonuclease VII large subunit [Bacteroidaceae bacterium]|nr:exodeoxyribonuclease VII large subunit [Bacteroidaceae bacterium]